MLHERFSQFEWCAPEGGFQAVEKGGVIITVFAAISLKSQ